MVSHGILNVLSKSRHVEVPCLDTQNARLALLEGLCNLPC